MSVKERINYNVLVMMYKVKNNMVPDYLCKIPDYLCKNLKTVGQSQPYGLRNVDKFRLPRMLSASAQNSLFFKGTKLLNSFLSQYECENLYPKDVKKIESYIRQQDTQISKKHKNVEDNSLHMED